MPTVNYLRVIGCEHETANLNGSYERPPKWQDEDYEVNLYTNHLK